MTNLKKLLWYSLSDRDISNFFNGGINILRFSDLDDYDNIDDVIGDYERCALLFEADESNHWCLIQMVRPPNKKPYILFFDSYGLIPENEFNYVPKSFMSISKQQRGTLIKLLIDQPLDVHYNNHKLQSMQEIDGQIPNDCGKWCCLIGLYNTLTEDQFAKQFYDHELLPDELCVLLYDELKDRKNK
jgi:hypothetical protein